MTLAPALAVATGLTVAVAGCAADAIAEPTPVRHRGPDHRSVSVSYQGRAKPLTMADPSCDSTGACAYPFGTSGTFTGDVNGTYADAGGAVIAPDGSFMVSKIQLVTATVRGCGKGTFALRIAETATQADGSGTGRVVPGSGTGDLRGLIGNVSGTGSAESGSSFSGRLRCRR